MASGEVGQRNRYHVLYGMVLSAGTHSVSRIWYGIWHCGFVTACSGLCQVVEALIPGSDGVIVITPEALMDLIVLGKLTFKVVETLMAPCEC